MIVAPVSAIRPIEIERQAVGSRFQRLALVIQDFDLALQLRDFRLAMCPTKPARKSRNLADVNKTSRRPTLYRRAPAALAAVERPRCAPAPYEPGASGKRVKMPELQFPSHNMSVPTVAGLLRDQLGGMKARKLALSEQQKARRARSRRRFSFWRAIADHIGREDAN